MVTMTPSAATVDAYWVAARHRVHSTRLAEATGERPASSATPPAWSFGAGPDDADALLELVLTGTKTGTSSAVASFAADDEPLPRAGDLSIILDGRAEPRALIVTTAIRVCPFEQVDAEHAAAEGEGDRSLAHWRAVHRKFWTDALAKVGKEFTVSTAVVLERFTLLDP